MIQQQNESGDTSHDVPSGVWIGVDLGTSNSACAVWDSTRGSPKWMRLKDIAQLDREGSSKWGRLVPSVVKIPSKDSLRASHSELLVGAQALETTAGTLLSSVKRLLGRKLADLDAHWASSMPYTIHEDERGELQIWFQTSKSKEKLKMTPVQVLGVLLYRMREEAQNYLNKYAARKRLDVPGANSQGDEPYTIQNAVIGIPAHFSKRQIGLVEEAARLAGLHGTVSTCLESTAAAMAYGLTLQETSDDSTIMVIDMGGGTSDITIAHKNRTDFEASEVRPTDDAATFASSYQVLVATGEERLGGDDIDQALTDYCFTNIDDYDLLSEALKRKMSSQVSKSCRQAKEKLCDLESPSKAETIRIDVVDRDSGRSRVVEISIDQAKFESILKPWLDRARELIQRALDDFHQVASDSGNKNVSEVILVGGTTRIPAIRTMIQLEFFPKTELGTSLNPMSSVAQGLAIQAALLSRLVPAHQLRSALMLDCTPHAIGVLMEEQDDSGGEKRSTFVEILKRNAPLPAHGSATFSLAKKSQPGVTIQAVEKVKKNSNDGSSLYEPMAKEPFTFLLRRLSKEQMAMLTHRTIEVGMKLDTNGQFTVSIFDAMDPEQVRKRERFKKEGQMLGFQQADIGSIFKMLWEDSSLNSEQFVLLGLLMAVVVMYIAVKVAFNEHLIVEDEN